MNKQIVTNSENRAPKRIDIFEEFVLWSAMPPSERFKLGIETQEAFVTFYGIGINTPTAWKRRRDFEARVTALRKEWAFGKTSAVIEGIYRAACKGNPHSQKLWLQYFHNFSEKQQVEVTQRVSVGVNDVVALIEALPEEKKKQHYDWLIQFMLDASIAEEQAKRDGDTSVWDNPLPANWSPRYKMLDTHAVEVEQPVSVETVAKPKITHRHFASDSCEPSIPSAVAHVRSSASDY